MACTGSNNAPEAEEGNTRHVNRTIQLSPVLVMDIYISPKFGGKRIEVSYIYMYMGIFYLDHDLMKVYIIIML